MLTKLRMIILLLLLIAGGILAYSGYGVVVNEWLRALVLPAGEFHAQYGKALNLKCAHPCAEDQARYLWQVGVVGFSTLVIGSGLALCAFLLLADGARKRTS